MKRNPYFRHFIIVIFAAALGQNFLISCGTSVNEPKFRELDSLKRVVHEINDEFKKIDSTRLREISHTANNNINLIKKYYTQPDSTAVEINSMITYYKAFRKVGAKYGMLRSRLKREIPYTIDQLDRLVRDLRNDATPADSVNIYYETEKAATFNLIETFKFYRDGTKSVIHQFDSITPIMDRFINQIKTDTLKEVIEPKKVRKVK